MSFDVSSLSTANLRATLAIDKATVQKLEELHGWEPKETATFRRIEEATAELIVREHAELELWDNCGVRMWVCRGCGLSTDYLSIEEFLGECLAPF